MGLVTKQIKDGAGALFTSYWWDDGTAASPVHIDAKALMSSITPRSFALIAATAHDVFPGGAARVYVSFRNTGPNDATYRINGTADGVVADGDFTLPVGESRELPFALTQRISFLSAGGTTIEGFEWK